MTAISLSQEESRTGELFGSLFSAFDLDNYTRSVAMFERRFRDAGFDLTYFKNKHCLDIGCGGGRYSIALAQLGASHVTGIDIAEAALEDARAKARALGVENVSFLHQSGEKLPFAGQSFDFVLFSGVLMIMEHPERSMQEVSRVLRPGGMLYMLVYATEGVRWPLINMLRNLAAYIGCEKFERLLQQAGLDVNKRRTYLDDLFVPTIDFYSWKRLCNLLYQNHFTQIQRWQKGRLDHEENLEAYREDLVRLRELFAAGTGGELSEVEETLLRQGAQLCTGCIDLVQAVIELKNAGALEEKTAMQLVIGQGHHRLTAIRE